MQASTFICFFLIIRNKGQRKRGRLRFMNIIPAGYNLLFSIQIGSILPDLLQRPIMPDLSCPPGRGVNCSDSAGPMPENVPILS
jgi:hypothetical protein